VGGQLVKIFQYAAAMFLLLCFGQEARCQLFDEAEPSLGDFRSVGISGSLQSFRPRDGNSEADSGKIRIGTPLWLAEYRQLGFRLALGFSSYKFNTDNRTEFTITAESTTDISLGGGPDQGNFFLPVVFSTNYVQATGVTNSSKDFNIADIGIGTGLLFRKFSQNFGVQFTGVGVIYYSSAGFSLESGSSTAVVAELQFLFRDLIGDGMTAGYRFEIERWSMSEESLNYTRQIHGPFIGIFF
jgi:hypothetical protein